MKYYLTNIKAKDSISVILSKKEHRQIILNNRLKKTVKEKNLASLNIINQLKVNKNFLKANIIALYYPIKYEIDLLELIKLFPEKRFCFPKIINKEMFFVEYKKGINFIKTKYGAFEPNGSKDISKNIELYLVPALGMTKNNYRLGHGAGYYDKFFKVYHNNYKIGIIYQGEEVEFMTENHDIPLNSYLKG